MAIGNLKDLIGFVAVAREESFTRAANRLGVTTSALSHTIRGLEERLGLRLLTRTTRKVALTAAGERLLLAIGPLFDEIEFQVDALSELRERPAGIIRLTCTDHVSEYVLRDRIAAFLRDYPEIRIEIYLDYGLTDIVGLRIDAGIRQGDLLDNEMIAVRISPDWRFSLVGSPTYFQRYPLPKTPHDLKGHECAGLRLTTSGGLWAWDFQENGRAFNVRVGGQLTFNSIMPGFQAALDGICLAYVPQDMTRSYVERGELIEILAEWSLRCQGFHIFYPNRRQPTPAFSALINALRYHD